MAGGTAGTAPLPKATVKLQPTQAMQRPSISAPPSAPVKRSAAADAEQFYEEKDPEAGLVPLSVICFVFSAVLMVIQVLGADNFEQFTADDSPIMAPKAVVEKWEVRNADKSWTNDFNNPQRPALPAIP